MSRSHTIFLAAALLVAATRAPAADCTRTSTGLIPLTAPYGGMRGTDGGLYPDGSNQRPAAHEAAGLRFAAGVKPLAPDGTPAGTTGKIVLLSIGMSNTTAEFSMFKLLADSDPEKNAQLIVVDGAVGGWSADRVVADPAAHWALVADRLNAAGVTAAQVQAVWIKQADASPTGSAAAEALALEKNLEAIVTMLPPRFPNLKLAYLSNRIYAGYASSALNPEPYAHASGSAVKLLIARQIQGVPELSYTAGQAPWVAWGPYLWADGLKPNLDGLTWACGDLQDDGTHPSDPAGRRKVALMLLDFFKTDTTARPWFVRQLANQPPTPKIAAIVNAASFTPELANNSIATVFGDNLASGTFSAQALPLPLTLGGTRVEVGGLPASLYFVSPTQINFVLPVTPLSFKVSIVREEVRSDAVEPKLNVFYAPGIFTSGASAAALHAGGRPITAQDPARPGEAIEIYGTGIGIRNPAILAPEVLPRVMFGETAGELMYAGPSPGWPGLYQWNVRVPAGASPELQIRYAAIVSNTAAIALAQ